MKKATNYKTQNRYTDYCIFLIQKQWFNLEMTENVSEIRWSACAYVLYHTSSDLFLFAHISWKIIIKILDY